VDTSQTRFCICGISSHLWTPVRQGFVSLALVVTCHSSVEPLSCFCMTTRHFKYNCEQCSSSSCCSNSAQSSSLPHSVLLQNHFIVVVPYMQKPGLFTVVTNRRDQMSQLCKFIFLHILIRIFLGILWKTGDSELSGSQHFKNVKCS
jgi:hypothetical protein